MKNPMSLLTGLLILASGSFASATPVICMIGTGPNGVQAELDTDKMPIVGSFHTADISAGELSLSLAVSKKGELPFMSIDLPSRKLTVTGENAIQILFAGEAEKLIQCNRY